MKAWIIFFKCYKNIDSWRGQVCDVLGYLVYLVYILKLSTYLYLIKECKWSRFFIVKAYNITWGTKFSVKIGIYVCQMIIFDEDIRKKFNLFFIILLF
jgi:hypothetical protein